MPLNSIEKGILAVDSINEPMIAHQILNIEGEIDADRLNRAILSALKAHPQMRTILRSKYFRTFQEVQEDLGEKALTVKDLAKLPDANYERCLSEWINQPLNLWKEFPFRALLLKKNEVESSLIFTGHHIAVDGLGAVLFIRKIFESYDKDVPEDSKSLDDIPISRKGDEILQFARSQRPSVEHYYMKMIYSLFHRFFIAPFHPTRRIFHDRSGQSEGTGYCNGTIDPAEFGQIRSRAKAARVTLNDVLLAACFRVIERWNSLHGKRSKCIRIWTPLFIGPKWPKDVVSNQVSGISLPTMPKDRADPVKLLHKVRANMASMVKNGIPFSQLYLAYLLSRFPLVVMRGMARFFMITRIYVDTIVVSNLGVIWPEAWREELRIGSARIVGIEGVPPVGSLLPMTLVTSVYNGRLQVCLGYRTGLFSREKAQRFLDLYVEEIRNYPVVREC